jgi:hypothetical protein
MSKQTAVEWLVENITKKYDKDFATFYGAEIEQAKAMEKQQSISDYCEGFKASGEGWNGEYGLKDMLDVAGEIDAEDYYNKTYGGDK